MVEHAWVLSLALLASALICTLLVSTQRLHGALTLDHDTEGAQKIHTHPVPRVGGVAIMAGLLAAAYGVRWVDPQLTLPFVQLIACALPVFSVGLLEDVTKRVSPRARLMAAAVSALLTVMVLGYPLSKLDTPGLDQLMVFTPLAVAFTCFAVAGVTHAVNITDGLNGLASGSVAIMLCGLGAMAWLQNDGLVTVLCLSGTVSLLGFMVWNCPMGKIFLGDGGAYLSGFWLAECAILLLVRNPDVSTWAVLLSCLYPAWETAFSIYRRRVVRKTDTDQPDMLHLHHLVLRRLVGQWVEAGGAGRKRHALSSALIWGMVASCQVMAVQSSHKSTVALTGVTIFAIFYNSLYQFLVMRKVRWVEFLFTQLRGLSDNDDNSHKNDYLVAPDEPVKQRN